MDKDANPPENKNDDDFCPRCGLLIAGTSKPGSRAGHFNQDQICRCPPDPAFTQGHMTQRLLTLKQSDDGTTFAPSFQSSDAGLINLAPGAIIGGSYEIIRMIGKGGMGEVYLAKHKGLNKQCALKLIPPDQVTELGWLRFKREARAVAKLNHLNVVQVSDFGIHAGCLPYCAMEYVDGKNLAELLKEQGPMPLPEAIELFKQICDGVDFAHRNGIIHRDLKPGNIMVTGTSQAATAKILDFGLAKLMQTGREQQSLTTTGDIFGSPFYMSPEQCDGESVDNRSDIYSIGCALFECLTGKPPFTGNFISAVMAKHRKDDAPKLESKSNIKFPDSMEIVMAKALRKNPGERHQTARELRADLERVILADSDANQSSKGAEAEPEPESRRAVETATTAKISLNADNGRITEKSDNSVKEKRKADIAEKAGNDSSRKKTADQSNQQSDLLARVAIASTIILLLGGLSFWMMLLFKPTGTERQVHRAASSTPRAQANISPTAALDKPAAVDVRQRSAGGPATTEIAKTVTLYENQIYLQGISKTKSGVIKQYSFPIIEPDSDTANTCDLGEFSAHESQSIVRLAGTQETPANETIIFTPSEFALYHPDFFQGFSDGDFRWLHFSFPDDYKTSLLQGFPPKLCDMKSINTLAIKKLPVGNAAEIDDFVISLINRFNYFDSLDFRVDINKQVLSRIKRLPELKGVRLFHIQNTFDFLTELKRCKHLRMLIVRNCPIAEQEADIVAGFSQLTVLIYRTAHDAKKIDPRWLKRISTFKDLRALNIGVVPYSQETFATLVQMKKLQRLAFTPDSTWSQSRLHELGKSMPHCDITLEGLEE